MLKPIFNFKLNHKIHVGMVTVGKYDGVHPCLTAATTAGKILIHSPHSATTSGGRITLEDSSIGFLNINQVVTSVLAGNLIFFKFSI